MSFFFRCCGNAPDTKPETIDKQGFALEIKQIFEQLFLTQVTGHGGKSHNRKAGSLLRDIATDPPRLAASHRTKDKRLSGSVQSIRRAC